MTFLACTSAQYEKVKQRADTETLCECGGNHVYNNRLARLVSDCGTVCLYSWVMYDGYIKSSAQKQTRWQHELGVYGTVKRKKEKKKETRVHFFFFTYEIYTQDIRPARVGAL